jgi:hypothetical protein
VIPEVNDVSLLVSEWKEKLLGEEKAGQEHFGGEIIVGPRDLVIREILVDRYLRTNIPDLDQKARPTTVFLWELGEGPPEYKRRGTRIGGTPWWPADKPWPLDSNGVPLRFVAQIDFGVEHSLDIKLPGELLSIFVSETTEYWAEHFDFFWHNPVQGMELLKPEQVPSPKTQDYIFGPFFGHPYMTYDYELYDWRSPDEWMKHLIDQAEERDLLETIMSSVGWPELVPVMQATKIGGIPHFIQGFMPGSEHCEWALSWTFLCTLSSVNLTSERPAPQGLLVNQSFFLPQIDDFLLGDVGQMYLWLDESRSTRYWWECT